MKDKTGFPTLFGGGLFLYFALFSMAILYPKCNVQAQGGVLDQAQKAYYDGRFNECIQLLAPLLEAQDLSDPQLDSAFQFLGAAYQQKGNLSKAEETFQDWLTFDEHSQIDERFFPAKVVAFFEKTKQEYLAELSKKKVGFLRLTGDISGTQVAVDGKRRRNTGEPLKVTVGEHRLEFRKTGQTPSVRRAEVRTELQTVEIPVEAAPIFPAPGGQEKSGIPEKRFFIGLHLAGGFNTYAMGDFNDSEIKPLRDGGIAIDEVKSGANLAAGIRFWPSAPFFLELGYERLMGGTSYEDPTGRIEYKLPANAFLVSGGYLINSKSPFRLGFSGGVGFYSSNGEISLTDSAGGSISADLEASGVGFQAFVLGVYPALPKLNILVEIGFRYAKAKDVEVLRMPTGIDLDWSGVVLRGAVEIKIPISPGS